MRTLYRAGAVHSPAAPSATAFVVDGDTIAWLGPWRDADQQAGTVDRRVDLAGALVAPGFVDAHVHVTETGLQLTGVDLTGARSLPQLLAAVEAATRRGRGRPVLGHGWDEALLAEGRPPTRAELDRAAAGGAVYLSRVDVHSAVISSALAAASGAKGLAGWDDDGRVERAAHHAARDFTRGTLTTTARLQLQLTALRAAAAAGIVAVHEMSAPHIAPEDDLRALLDLASDPQHALPAVAGYRGELVADPGQARAVLERLGAPLAGLAGDLCVDGSVGSRTAAYLQDYQDAPGRRGHLYLTVEQVRDHVAACTRSGLQAGFHAIGDEAVVTVRRGVRRAAEQVGIAAVRVARHRLEHLESIDSDGIADLADLGVCASVQPAFDARWGGRDGMYAGRLGAQRALRMNPFAALATAGVRLALGSDSPITPFDPWGAIRACTSHHVPGQRIGVARAFSAHTVGGWQAAGVGGSGVLLPGAPADFAAWETSGATGAAPADRDPGSDPAAGPGIADLAADAPAPRCLFTVRAGRVLHDGR
jgi:predicted amidohydrolase YtcJ